MKYVCIFLMAILLLPPTGFLCAQNPDSIERVFMADPVIRSLHVHSIPFGKIEVLDNRLDTSCFFIRENGAYPVARGTFRQSMAETIRKHLEKEMSPLVRGDKVLLLNVEQLYISNVFAIPRRQDKGPLTSRWDPARECIQFSGKAYYRVGKDSLRPILSFHYRIYDYGGFLWLPKDFCQMLNHVLSAAANFGSRVAPPYPSLAGRLHAREYRAYFVYAKDTALVAMREVDRSVRSKWGQYAIFSHREAGDGIYVNFDDFREGRLEVEPVKLLQDATDSTFRLNPGPWAPFRMKKLRIWPYAVAYNGELYYSLGSNKYLKLTRRDYSFYFHVPSPLPDMYMILSLRAAGHTGGYGSSGLGAIPGSLLVYGAAVVASVVVQGVIQSQGKKKNQPVAVSDRFRDCYIDMDSGDIEYLR